MKLKLTGLLLFSQAVAPAIDPWSISRDSINKNNYQPHLCNEDLFSTTPRPIYPCADYQSGLDIGGLTCSKQMPVINTHYNTYCREKENYEKAMQDAGGKCAQPSQDNATYPCVGNGENMLTRDDCVDERGIRLAKVCLDLKRDKSAENAWNHVIPTLESCGSKKLRFN